MKFGFAYCYLLTLMFLAVLGLAREITTYGQWTGTISNDEGIIMWIVLIFLSFFALFFG